MRQASLLGSASSACLSADNSSAVLPHCHGDPGCSGPEEVALDSSRLSCVITSGSPHQVQPVLTSQRWRHNGLPVQGSNTLGHLLWFPLRGRAGTCVRAEGSKPLKAWKTQGDGETEGPRLAAGETHSKGWGEGGVGAGRMSTEYGGAWDSKR